MCSHPVLHLSRSHPTRAVNAEVRQRAAKSQTPSFSPSVHDISRSVSQTAPIFDAQPIPCGRGRMTTERMCCRVARVQGSHIKARFSGVGWGGGRKREVPRVVRREGGTVPQCCVERGHGGGGVYEGMLEEWQTATRSLQAVAKASRRQTGGAGRKSEAAWR